MRKAVDLLPGDIVWVPSSISNRTKQQLWPAKFVKKTNKSDICMVVLYGSTPQKTDEQFLVDTESIIAFDQHEVNNPEPDLQFAYELALRDFKVNNMKKVDQSTLPTSAELCDFVESLLLAELMDANSQAKEVMVNEINMPKFNAKDVPVQTKDLKLYFKRMIPQAISYLLDCRPSRQALMKDFLQQTKNKIIKHIISQLAKNAIDFEN